MGRTSNRLGSWRSDGIGDCSRNRQIERVGSGKCLLHRRLKGFKESDELGMIAEMELESLTPRNLVKFRHCIEESGPVVVEKLDGAVCGFDGRLSHEEVVMEGENVLMNF